MNTVADVLTVLLVIVLGLTATGDFMRPAGLIATTDRLRIPRNAVPVLGGIKVLTALALVAGTQRIRIAEATGVFLVGYFAVAVLTHIRVKDGAKNTAPAFLLLVVSTLFVLATFAR